jgi:ABC-type branched-subunit amino acid transport system substrate-binding protein
MAAEPFKVGYLHEFLDIDPAPFFQAIRMRFDEAMASGELDRPVELVVREGIGLPPGTASAVQRAWQELAAEGALAIIGPGNTDNALAVMRDADEQRVPTINFSGCERSRSAYNFHYQLGSLADEGPLLARAIAHAGLARVAVIRDRSPIGEEYWWYFHETMEDLGIPVVSDQKVSPVADDLTAAVEAARASGADALAYLGMGLGLTSLMEAMSTVGWQPPSFTDTAGLRYYFYTPEQRRLGDGWVYVDMYDEENETTQAMLDRYEQRFGSRPVGPALPGMYDMATLVVGGLRLATVHTPEGVMEGLERVRQLPAACGGAGTILGFGPWERGALKGPDYLLLRRMGPEASTRFDLPPSHESARRRRA